MRHFGLDYGYESWKLVPTDPLPAELHWLRDRAATLAGLDPAELAQILVSKYPPGATIGWHRDAPMFGAKVIGVSLAAPCRIGFQRGKGDARQAAAAAWLTAGRGDAGLRDRHSSPASGPTVGRHPGSPVAVRPASGSRVGGFAGSLLG